MLIAFASGILAVFFDFLLEPVAIIFDYWNWNNNIIPLQNYAAWFFISFILAFSFLKAKLDMNTDLPAVYFIIQAIFFLVLQVTL